MLVPPKNKLILLIEDDVDDERLTLRALRKNNVVNEVVVACDGQEALDYLMRRGAFSQLPSSSMPSLIVLDLKLPKLSGLEVLQRIRSNSDTATIPVVVLTASNSPKQVEECYAAGANSYILKPDTAAEFSETILNVVMYWLLLNEAPQPVTV